MLSFFKIEKIELISLGSPFRSEPIGLPESAPPDSAVSDSPMDQTSRQEFETVWAGFEDPRGTARGWCGSPPNAIGLILQGALPHYEFVTAPDSQSPFIEGASAQRR